MRTFLFACALLWMGCRSDQTDRASAPKTSAPAVSVSAPAASASSASPPGKGNFEASLQAVLKCPWSNGVSYSCEAFNNWNGMSKESDDQQRRLVELLSDPRPIARYVAAKGLFSVMVVVFGEKAPGPLSTRDKSLADKVIAAAERETDPTVGGAVGEVVGRIDLEATGWGDRVVALAKGSKLTSVRTGVVRFLMGRNEADRYLAVVLDALRTDPEPEVKKAAVLAISGLADPKALVDRRDRACDALKAAAGNANEVVASTAVRLAMKDDVCSKHWDNMLGIVEGRARAGTIQESDWVTALKNLAGQTTLSGPTRSKAASAARSIAGQRKNQAYCRSGALEALRLLDAEGAPGFAAKFVSDPEESVANKAKEIAKK